MMAIFTSCMPEIIGDDLTAFIKNARAKGIVPKDFPLPFANTPSFNGSHVTGYDAMLLAILQTLTEGKKVEGRCTGKLNLLPGFDANTGNYREYTRILDAFEIPHTILADISESFDSPNDGTYRLYPGGTPLAEAADSGERQGDAHRRAVRDREDLRLGEGELRREARRRCPCRWGSRRPTPSS